MLDWLRIIGEFFIERLEMVFDLFILSNNAISTLISTFMLAPTFLSPILQLTISVIVFMWVVNIF